jgi:hypothetical protein
MRKETIRILGGAISLVLLGAAAAASAAPIKLRVAAELANIRLKPSISSAIVRQIPQGALLEAVSKEGEWYLVKLEPDESGTTSGYVHESLVVPLEEVSKPEKRAVVEEAKKEAEKPAQKEAVRAEERLPGTAAEEAGRLMAGISAGGAYTAAGALNEAAQGLADYYANQLQATADQDVGPAHWGLSFGGELAFPVVRNVFVVAGLDYLWASRETLVSYAKGNVLNTLSAKPEIRAIPISLSVTYYPTEWFYLKAGAAYYFAKCSYSYRLVQDKSWQEYTGEATAQQFGLCAGLGFELAVGESAAFFIEGTGRSAAINDFSGTGTVQDSTMAAPAAEEGKLYAYDVRISSQDLFPLFSVRNKVPSEAGVVNARVAEISFSGFALKLGVRIKF